MYNYIYILVIPLILLVTPCQESGNGSRPYVCTVSYDFFQEPLSVFFETTRLSIYPKVYGGGPQESIKHLDIALQFVGTTEIGGDNRGPDVEKFLLSVGRRPGDAWCAAYVSYCLIQADVETPTVRSGLARAFKVKGYISAKRVLRGVSTIPKGSIVGWQRGETVFGHVGLTTTDWSGKYGSTIEGNTSSGKAGSQSDGDGVYLRNRSISPTNYFRITWFTLVTYPVEYEYNMFSITEKPMTTMETLRSLLSYIF